MEESIDILKIDILTQWTFAGLAFGGAMLVHLLTTIWRCHKTGKSDMASMLRWQKRFGDCKWWVHAALPIYVFHQFEEHGIDLLGHRYNF
jgi:hypothetical protein